MNCLLIDVGSTFIKYSIYDDRADCFLLQDKMPFPSPCLDDGVHFHVPLAPIQEAILAIFQQGQKSACQKALISVQMHGYILKNAQGAYSPYISWRDQSGDLSDAQLQQLDLAEMGTSVKKNLPLVKLWHTRPDGEFFTLGSYIAHLLTGVNATHVTDGCASGFFHADTGKPNAYAPPAKLPLVYPHVLPLGTHAGITVYTPVGDHQISYLGSGAGEDKYLINIGTATQLCCVDDAQLPAGAYEKRPYFFPGKRLYTVSGLMGGGELMQGGSRDTLFHQLLSAMETLPRKHAILLGGGGAPQVYHTLKERFGELGISLHLIEHNIGMEGLKAMMQMQKTQAGTMLSEVGFLNFPLIAKNTGLDFMIVDNEHGYFDTPTLAGLIMNANLCSMPMILRIGDSSRGYITKLADMGAHGFLLPMTNTAEDIRHVVNCAMYTPVGNRGVSTTRAHTFYDPPALQDYMPTANQNMRIYAQIETRQGMENLDEILAVEGVEGIFVGPNDLSVDLGCIGEKAPVLSAITQIAQAAQRSGKPWGIITNDQALLDHALSLGVDLISCGSELNMLINGCKKIRAMFK